MDYSCIASAIDKLSNQFWSIERDQAVGLILFSVLLAVLCAPAVLVLYQRRVQKLMSMSVPNDANPSVTDSTARAKPATVLDAIPTPEALLAAADERGRALWKALAFSVAAFTVGIALAITISPDAPGELSRRPLWEWVLGFFGYLIFVGSLSVPMVLLGTASGRFAGLFWKWFAPAYVGIAAVAMIYDDEMAQAERVETFVQGIVILAVLYAALGGRRMRNVVPLLSVLICLLILALATLGSVTDIVSACAAEDSLVAASLLSLASLAGMWAAWRAVLVAGGGLARAYERKLLSDAQFQVGAWMILITLIFALAPGEMELGLNIWSLGVIPPLIISLWLYRKLLKRVAPWKPPRALLLLRVFARDKRGERLLDEIAFRWRFIGPIHMIGGPDLAKTTLEPNELLLFLRRGLRQILVTDRPSLERRLTELDLAPDPDARYRINESFCSDNAWQDAVRGLLDVSDAVLLDLRGFTAARRGTAFEVRLLAERNALKKTVFITDNETDMEAIEQSMAGIPNAKMPAERILRSDSRVAGADIFRLLVSGTGNIEALQAEPETHPRKETASES